jgi:hypothetical protein
MRNGLATTANSDMVAVADVPLISRKISAPSGTWACRLRGLARGSTCSASPALAHHM